MMETEQCPHGTMTQDNRNGGDKSSFDGWTSASAAAISSDDNSGGFECNICLDSLQDPVVTFCGHLFCWPCIYKWIHLQSIAHENYDQQPPQCPVCKSEISRRTLIPLYGRHQGAKPSKAKASNLNLLIPRRPFDPAHDIDIPRSPPTMFSPHSAQSLHYSSYRYDPQLYHHQLGSFGASTVINPTGGAALSNICHPLITVLGDMICARIFGNSTENLYARPNSYNLEHRASPRMRRRIMQADKSLDRISFFLFCCVVLCLLSF